MSIKAVSRTYPEPRWKVSLRNALIRAMPTCTLWAVDLYRDRAVFRPWPRWGIDRRDIEDCPGTRRGLWRLPVWSGS